MHNRGWVGGSRRITEQRYKGMTSRKRNDTNDNKRNVKGKDQYW